MDDDGSDYECHGCRQGGATIDIVIYDDIFGPMTIFSHPGHEEAAKLDFERIRQHMHLTRKRNSS